MPNPSGQLVSSQKGLNRNTYLVLLWMMVCGPYLAVAVGIWYFWNLWFSWIDVTLLVVTYVPISAGVTVGLHRYFTHRSFETTRPVRIILGILALLAIEGTITQWVANHLYHHAHSDTDDDLHSPIHGLWHAHSGWLFINREADPNQYGITRALLNDSDIQLLDRYRGLFALLSVFGTAPIGYIFGGWSGAASAFLLSGVIRFFLVHHFTWAINSLCHVIGDRPYRSNDSSTNVWFLAWPTLGESWHRTHHAFPWSALQGSAWWNDLSYSIIKTLEFFRLAWNIRVPTADQYASKRLIQPVAVPVEMPGADD